MARCHARLQETVKRFGQKQLRRRDELARRIEQGDHTLLLDVVEAVLRDLQAIRDAICKHMEDAPPTKAEPGTAEKIEELRRRFADGKSLWIDGDNAAQPPNE